VTNRTKDIISRMILVLLGVVALVVIAIARRM
jgi:hypothetical protein